MSENTKKPASTNVIELVKSLRSDIAQYEAEKLASPQEIGAALLKGIKDAIREHQDELVKMRTLEVAAIKKNERSLTVFDLIKSAELKKGILDAADGEDVIDLKHANDPAKRLKNGNGPDTVVPSDKPSKKVEQGEGSGGEMGSKSVFAYLKAAKKPPEATGTPGYLKSEADVAKSVFSIDPKTMSSKKQPGGGSGPGGIGAAAPTAKLSGPKPPSIPALAPSAPKAPGAVSMPKPSGPPTMGAHATEKKSEKKESEGEECPYCKKSLSLCKCA